VLLEGRRDAVVIEHRELSRTPAQEGGGLGSHRRRSHLSCLFARLQGVPDAPLPLPTLAADKVGIRVKVTFY